MLTDTLVEYVNGFFSRKQILMGKRTLVENVSGKMYKWKIFPDPLVQSVNVENTVLYCTVDTI